MGRCASRIATFAAAALLVSCAHGNTLPSVARTQRPNRVRGLYVNRWAALANADVAAHRDRQATEVNALVIDVKDDRGFLLYRSSVALAQAIGADTNQTDVRQARTRRLDTMRAHGIFPIARIVVAKDPLLANSHREWAVKRKSDGTPWLDKNGRPWLDPHHRDIWGTQAISARRRSRSGSARCSSTTCAFPTSRD